MTRIPRSLAYDMLFGSNKIDGHVALDAIYDSFESRTCESCRYFCGLQELGGDVITAPYCGLGILRYFSSSLESKIVGQEYGSVDYRDSSCNKWQPAQTLKETT